MRDAWLPLSAGCIRLTYWVLDGHLGNHHALQRARQHHLPLLATLRCDATRYCPSAGPRVGHGPRRTYGDPVDDANLPAPSGQEPTVEGHLQPRGYQMHRWHKEGAPPVHVVLLVQTPLRPQAQARGILCSRALPLASAALVDDEGVRCYIACNVRDAQQSWGVADVMTITPTGVSQAAHLSWCMVQVSYRLQAAARPRDPASSVLDVTAHCRGSTYVEETIPLLPETPAPVVWEQMRNTVACFGRIHASQPSVSFV